MRRAGLALVVVVGGACATDLSVGPRAIASLAIAPNAPTLAVGETTQLLAVARDSNGVPFVGTSVTWSTSNPQIVSITPNGLIEGMSVGSATITAAAGAKTATATVTVSPAPTIGLSRTTVAFSGIPSAPNPAPEAVTIANAGGGTLDDLQLGTVAYGAGATGWLSASLDRADAPATLTLVATTGSLALGTYSATVPVSSASASNSPQTVTVTFTVAAGAAAVLQLNAGDNQNAAVGAAVAIPPSVVARDAFNNPVPGVQVTFAVAAGGGALTGPNPVTTSAAGLAQTGWTLGNSLGVNSLTATAPGLTGSPVTFNATATAGPATQIAASAGDLQTTTVNTAVPVAPAVLVTDALGNPVAGFTVTFAIALGGGNLTGATQLTNASGIAQVGGWTLGQTAGANSLTATGSGLTGSPVTFTATATPGPATQLTICGGNAQTATTGSAVALDPCIAVRDAFDNAIAGQAVTFTVTGGGGSVSGVNPAVTNAGGQARISWTLGTTAGANTLLAASPGLPNAVFTATGVPGPATQLVKVAGDSQTVQVATPVPVPPRVQVQDPFGNGVSGVIVTFAITAGGGALTGPNPVVTNAQGFAQVVWTLGISSGTNTLTASAPGLTGSPLTFTASGVAGGATTIAPQQGNSQSATVNTAVTVPPSVLVTDALGNPVAGVSVTFAVTQGGGNISGASQTTNASGLAQVGGWVLGQTAGVNTLTATAGGLSGSPVTFTATGTAGAASQIALSAGNAQSATVNTAVATPPRVVVRDAFNNPVSGVSVAFTVVSGNGSLTGTNPTTTDALGLAQIGWVLGTLAGPNTLHAAATGLTGSPVVFTATATPGAATALVITAGDNQSAPVGTLLPIAPQVQVRDQFGNAVAGTSVTFAITAGGGSLTGPNPVNTDALGFAQIGWTVGAGTNSLTATSGTLTGSPATFTATGLTAPPTDIAANAGNAQTATVNTAVAIPPSVLVTDGGGNPVSGVAVTFAVASGGGNISGASAFTNGLGIAQVGGWVLGQTAGPNTLTATAPGLNGSPVTFTATGVAGAATQIALSAGNGQSATVNTAVTTPPRVLVRDAFNNPVSGVSVTFAVTAGAGSLTGTNPATTDVSGFAQIGWTLGQIAGANSLTATATGLSGSPVVFTATGTAGAATQVVKTAGDGQSAGAGAQVPVPPQVQVRDQFGNGVAGVTVTFAIASGGGSLIGTNPVVTGASGFAQIGWQLGNTAGPNSLTASSLGLGGSPLTFTATGTAGGATTIALSAGNGQTATVNTAVTVPPAVLVTDINGNPVAGVNVTFAVTGGGGTVVPTTAVATNALGIAQATSWTLGITAGTNNNTLTATAPGLTGSPVVFTATATAGAPTLMTRNAGDAQSATVNTAVGVPPQVLVRDAFNNPAAGVSVTFVVTSGAGSLTGVNPVATDAAGLAQIGWTLGTTAGANTLNAAVSGLSPVTFTATGTSGAATQIFKSAGDSQSATVSTAVATPPRVQVRDQFGNGVGGVSVTFAVASGGGGLTGTNPATTDASGFAQIGWTLGPTAGANTLTATSGTLSGSPLTFTATGIAGGATTIALSAGNGQSATVNTAVATAPAVLVTDAGGNPVAGVSVTFAVTGGSGTVAPTTPVLTSVLGIAQATSWTLGTAAGSNNNTVTATSGTLAGSPITFTASATAGAATQIAKNAGDAQSATVGTPVATPPRVLVRDAFNNPVAGVSVTFAVAAGGGTLTGTNPATTDASGFAQIAWTLGTTAGANSLTADVTGLPGVTFTATGTAGAATQIVKTAGDNQSAQVNALVGTPPQVQARDQFGNAVQGVPVTFTEADAGTIVPATPATIATDAAGFAALTSWTLGPAATTYTVTATSGGLAGSPLTFTATAFAGGATTIELSVAPNGNNQTDTVGAILAVAYRVRVTDGTNPVAGIPVAWAVTSGGGSITPTSTTDVNGFATAIRTLGTGVGTQTATASVGGLINSPIVFAATATHGNAAQIALNAGNNQSAVVNTAVATPASVTVRDQHGNPVAGFNVTFAVTAGGGSLTGANPAITNASGVAQIGWTLGVVAGTGNQSLTATAAGLTGSPVSFTASATADAPSAAQSTIAATSPITASTGASQSVITVTVRDQFSNPIGGAAVTWSATGSGNTLTSETGTTNASGVFNLGRLSSTAVGSKTISAIVNPGAGQVAIAVPATVVVDPAAVSATLSTVAAAPGSIVASAGGVTSTVTVTARDAFGNLVPSAPVVLAATGSGNAFAPAGPGNTNGGGVFTAAFSSTVAQAKTISATIAGVPIVQTAGVTVTHAAAASIALSAGDGQSATVNNPVATSPRVIVRDAFSNAVTGTTVTFAVTQGGGSVQGINPVTTDGNGFAQIGWTLGTVAGSNNNTLTATATGLSGSPVTFTASATAGAPSAAQSLVAATSPITASSGASQATITITVRDQFNNPVSGASVTWSATGAGNTLTNATGTTDGTGVFNTGRLSSTVAESKTVTAVVNGTISITQTALVVVNPAGASAALSTVAAAPGSIVASSGGVTSTVTVTARDAFGNLVPSAAVVLAASGGGNAFALAGSGNTDGSGVFTAAFSSTVAQAKTISATIGGVPITQTASVTVTHAAAASIALSAGDGQSATVNTPVATPPRVVVRDAFSNPVTGTAVTFAVTQGGGSIQGTNPAATDVNGFAQVGWSLGTVAGSNNNTLTATATGLTGSPVTFTASATAGAPSAAQSLVAATSPITASNGASQSTITVTVRDQFSNPINGANVTWSATGGNNALVSTTGTTNASGVFNAGRLSSTLAESKTVSAVVNGTVAITQTAVVVVNPAAVNATQSTVVAGTAGITACSTGCVVGTTASLMTVTARDQFANVVPNAAVVLAATGVNNVFAPAASGNADGNGVFTATFRSITAQAKTISATINAVGITQTAAVTVTADAAATMALNAGDGQSAVAGTAVATDPAVIVTDQFGNPSAGVLVTFAVTGGGGTVDPVTSVGTDGLGIARVNSWTLGTVAGSGNNTLSATSGGLAGSPVIFTASATVGVPSAAQSSVAATSPITATSGASQSTITVTVRDQFNNPISGANVTWSATGTGNTQVSSTGTTDALGVFNAGRLSSTVAQNKTISAIVNPGAGQVAITQTATVVVNPDVFSAAQSLVAAAPGSIIASSGTVTSTITVTVRDQFNNPLSGRTVDISATGAGNTVTDPLATTNASGVATGTISSTVAGAKTVSATANGSAITQTASVTVTHAAAATIAVNAGNGQSAIVNNLVGVAPSVLVTDAFGNPVLGQNVAFTVTGGGGTLTPASPATIATAVTGIAQVTSWRVGTAAGLNNNTLTAAATGLAGSPVTFTATATADGPSGTLSTIAATSPITASSGASQATITVTVRDQFSNPISGANVVWAATGTGNTVTNTSGTTDGSGVFNLGRLSSTVAASKTISATINGSIAITPTASVTVNPGALSASISGIGASHTQMAACNTSCVVGTSAVTIVVTARDQFGNLISGLPVSYSATGTSNTFNPATGTTNAGGMASTTFTSTVAQSKAVSATVNSVLLGSTAPVGVVAGPTTNIVILSTNPQTNRVGTNVASPPSVRTLDQFGNFAGGRNVTFTITSGGGSSSPASGSVVGTNTAGIATMTSWTLSDATTEGATGLMPNTLTASVAPCSGTCSVQFTGNAFYGWANHVAPILSTGGPCQFCHSVVFTQANTVGVAATLGACAGQTRIVAGNELSGVLYRKAANAAPCGTVMPPSTTGLSAAQLKTIRAWIRNGALNN